MPISERELDAVVQELAPPLTKGWVQKVFQPLPDVVLLEIRVPGHTHRLLCSIHERTARLHLVRQPLANPPTPPSFCQLLRARIQGARIDRMERLTGDRIVRLDLTAQDGSVALVAELFSRNGDLLFLDSTDHVLATLRNNRTRIGRPYGRPTAAPAVPAPQELEADSLPTPSEDDPFPLSAKLERQYGERETEEARLTQVHARESALRKALKKGVRRMEALRRDLEQAGRYESYARYGELLKANLGSLKKGLSTVSVIDYYDERLPELTIPLDPLKSPQANMDGYFAKYRKYLTAQREITPRLAAIETDLRRIQTELDLIKSGQWQPPPQAQSPATTTGLCGKGNKPSSQSPRGPFRRFASADGQAIFVGRNARENDALTFGLANSDDLWLHARGVPGSHVVVRMEKGHEPTPTTLLDAATLALLYSDLKKSGKGEVIYTRRKWVRKATGRAAGAVTVTQDKAIYVTLDKKRLEALKERSAARQE